jgi:hypothetical protein
MRATRVSPRWQRLSRRPSTRQAPPVPPVLKAGPAAPPPAFVIGASGSAEGGRRAPAAGIAAATLSGLGQSGAALCFLLGAAAPFTAIPPAALHPTRAQSVPGLTADTTAGAMAGLACPADARDLI